MTLSIAARPHMVNMFSLKLAESPRPSAIISPMDFHQVVRAPGDQPLASTMASATPEITGRKNTRTAPATRRRRTTRMKTSNRCPPHRKLMRPGPSQELPPRRRKGPIWWHKDICAESKVQAVIGREDYFLSADGLLMPAENDQPPPDLRSFQLARK